MPSEWGSRYLAGRAGHYFVQGVSTDVNVEVCRGEPERVNMGLAVRIVMSAIGKQAG